MDLLLQIIGWVGSAVLVVSLLQPRMLAPRMLNLIAAVSAKLTRLRLAVGGLRSGRGAHLGSLISHTLVRFDTEIAAREAEIAQAGTVTDPVAKESLLANAERKLERLGPQLDIVHHVIAKYRDAVGGRACRLVRRHSRER